MFCQGMLDPINDLYLLNYLVVQAWPTWPGHLHGDPGAPAIGRGQPRWPPEPRPRERPPAEERRRGGGLHAAPRAAGRPQRVQLHKLAHFYRAGLCLRPSLEESSLCQFSTGVIYNFELMQMNDEAMMVKTTKLHFYASYQHHTPHKTLCNWLPLKPYYSFIFLCLSLRHASSSFTTTTSNSTTRFSAVCVAYPVFLAASPEEMRCVNRSRLFL